LHGQPLSCGGEREAERADGVPKKQWSAEMESTVHYMVAVDKVYL
jgi:hypothetical protein